MLTDFVLDDTSIGKVIGGPHGFIVNLSMTRPPAVDSISRRGAHFTLRDDRPFPVALRNMISFDPRNWTTGVNRAIWVNASVPYTGNLTVVSVPPGSEWDLTLSDVANIRTPVSFQAYIAGLRAGGPKANMSLSSR
jgi:hypothetical protein